MCRMKVVFLVVAAAVAEIHLVFPCRRRRWSSSASSTLSWRKMSNSAVVVQLLCFLLATATNFVGAVHCYKCNSTKTLTCKDEITNSTTVVLSSCSFGIGTHCATISYSNLDGVAYVERDCLPTNLDCDTLEKFMWGRYGPFENFKCRLCQSEKCNYRSTVDEERRYQEYAGEATKIYKSKIAIFLYILFLAILIGLAALFEF